MDRIVICDDEIEDLQKVKDLVVSCCQKNAIKAEVICFTRGDECLRYLREKSARLVLLDIYLQDISGCEVARILRGFDEKCAIAFVTSSREYALDGFEVGACHYLVKPVTKEQIEQTFIRAGLIDTKEKKYLTINNNHVGIKVDLDLIVYVEVYDKQSIIHLRDGRTLKTYQTLSELANDLYSDAFLRTHRSYLVNMRYIHLLQTTEFVLTTGEKVPIRQAGRKEIKETYMEYLFSSVRGGSNGN
ncbi:MAG: LytR/AlgR family response regulator transcription factor [Acidaminococcaceae bacterium]